MKDYSSIRYLPTYEDEMEFFETYIRNLMKDKEHEKTAKLIYCKATNQTIEEFDRRKEASCKYKEVMDKILHEENNGRYM